jgi:hypothetical protein
MKIRLNAFDCPPTGAYGEAFCAGRPIRKGSSEECHDDFLYSVGQWDWNEVIAAQFSL